MIALDTNVLVRFLVEDDPEQSERARALLRGLEEAEEPAFVSEIVLCELVWVLKRSYRLTRPETASILRDLLRARQFTFPSTDRLARAVEAFAKGKAGFADYLISEHALRAGCRGLASFDKALIAEGGFFLDVSLAGEQL